MQHTINGFTFNTDHQPGRVEFDFSQHPVALETLGEIMVTLKEGFTFGSAIDAETGERVSWSAA